MERFFDYTKNILKLLIWPFTFIFTQYLIFIIYAFIFMNKEKLIFKTISNYEVFNDYKFTDLYNSRLSMYLIENKLWIVLISFVIFLPIFLKLYKKYKKGENKIKYSNMSILIILGGAFGMFYNSFLFQLNKIFNFHNMFSTNNNLNIFISILCSGIMGPILEELLYRGYIYNKLKTKYQVITSAIITSFIFAIMHANMIQMIYTCLLSLIMIFVYEKYKTIKAPILVHIGANIFVSIYARYIASTNIYINTLYMFISLIIVILYFVKKVKKNEYKKILRI